jgi:hypothetical protein
MGVPVSAWIVVCALIGGQAPDAASLARIKAALAKPPPKLIIVVPPADFRVNIEAVTPFADLFEVPVWVTPIGPYDAPKTGRDPHDGTIVGVSMDPGVIAHSIANSIKSRRAHSEVMEAIADYCAVHRDEPGAAGICGGAPR